jgi:hypothetical protein
VLGSLQVDPLPGLALFGHGVRDERCPFTGEAPTLPLISSKTLRNHLKHKAISARLFAPEDPTGSQPLLPLIDPSREAKCHPSGRSLSL